MDDLTDQLRRYADAAETHLTDVRAGRPELPVGPDRPSSSIRVLAAASVAVVLLGAVGAFLIGTGDEQLRTAPVDPGGVDGPAAGDCPTPRSDAPRVSDVQFALPWVASADLQLSTDERVQVVIDPGGPREVTVGLSDFGDPTSDPESPLPRGFPRTTVSLCDPFAGAAATTLLPAAIIEPLTSLQFHPGGTWTVNLWSGPGTDITNDDLREIAAGMSWPAPSGPTGTCDAVAGSGTGSLTISHLPDGFQPEAQVDEAIAPGGTADVVEHFFRDDDLATLGVSWFAAADPSAVIRAATGEDADQVTITGCVLESGGVGWTEGPVQVSISRGPDRVVAAGQLEPGEGWIVVGADGTTEREVLEVAEGLRP